MQNQAMEYDSGWNGVPSRAQPSIHNSATYQNFQYPATIEIHGESMRHDSMDLPRHPRDNTYDPPDLTLHTLDLPSYTRTDIPRSIPIYSSQASFPQEMLYQSPICRTRPDDIGIYYAEGYLEQEYIDTPLTQCPSYNASPAIKSEQTQADYFSSVSPHHAVPEHILTPPTSRRSSTETEPTTIPSNRQIKVRSKQKSNSRPNMCVSESDRKPKSQENTSSIVTTGTNDTKVNAKLRARQAHSLVERRYRENLNSRITQLHETLQHTRFGARLAQSNRGNSACSPTNTTSAMTSMYNSSGIGTGTGNVNVDIDVHGLAPTSTPGLNPDKIRKSDILVSAMVYIDHAESEMRRMNHEIARLNSQIDRMGAGRM